MIKPEHLAIIECELKCAMNKHPTFINRIDSDNPDDPARKLIEWRKISKDEEASNECSFEAVLMEEVYETLYELHRRRPHTAKIELAQVIAVCVRMMEYLDKEIENGYND